MDVCVQCLGPWTQCTFGGKIQSIVLRDAMSVDHIDNAKPWLGIGGLANSFGLQRTRRRDPSFLSSFTSVVVERE
jgi:hypothetical protein